MKQRSMPEVGVFEFSQVSAEESAWPSTLGAGHDVYTLTVKNMRKVSSTEREEMAKFEGMQG